METKTYPEKSYSYFQTTPVLGCAKCRGEIRMYTPVVSDGSSYWHKGCEPGAAHDAEAAEEQPTLKVTGGTDNGD